MCYFSIVILFVIYLVLRINLRRISSFINVKEEYPEEGLMTYFDKLELNFR